MNSLQEQVILYCIQHSYPVPVIQQPANGDKYAAKKDKYAGIKECMKNVVRTNNARKLQYCNAR